MESLGIAVKTMDVSPDAVRRRLAAGLACGILAIGATFAGQVFAQASPHARPHAMNNQPEVNAKHAKPAPGAGAPRFAQPPTTHAAPARGGPASRSYAPVRAPARPRYQASMRHQPSSRHYEPQRFQSPPSRAEYRFRDSDRLHLQRHYGSSLRTVRVDRRPVFMPGRVIPPMYRPQVVVLPAHVHRHLPPPPRGYQVGYYQGYSVVYDPVTFTILSVLDLLTR